MLALLPTVGPGVGFVSEGGGCWMLPHITNCLNCNPACPF